MGPSSRLHPLGTGGLKQHPAPMVCLAPSFPVFRVCTSKYAGDSSVLRLKMALLGPPVL